VVPARRADWSVDPFTFLEKDGYFYGRGTTDNKAGAAMLVATSFGSSGRRSSRGGDLVLILEGDEETAGSCIAWLVAQHRDLIDAEFALNTDAGGGVLRDGRRVMFAVQASEKVYPPMCSKRPTRAGTARSRAPRTIPCTDSHRCWERLAQYQFPVKLNEVSRAFFERSAALESGSSPTTCGVS